MKMLKTAALFCSIILLSASLAFAQKKSTVYGQFTNCKFKSVTLVKLGQETTNAGESKIDESGNFSIEVEQKNTEIYKLELQDGLFVSLIVNPGDKIKLEANMEDLMGSLRISGSEHSQSIYNTDKVLKKYKNSLDSINNAYYQGMSVGISDSIVKELTKAYQKIETDQNAFLSSFIKANTGSIACLFFVDRLNIDEHFDVYEALDKDLFEKYPENFFVKNFHGRVANSKKLAVGGEAPEIALPDPDGNIVKLSSTRGKVVVIDFWASWCGPCRKESPNMVRIYNAHKDEGFTIFSVSLDKTKDAWVKAIKDDNLAWLHVSDLKFWQCEAAQTYNVTAVPYTVLLDRQGKIVAKNLRGQELENKIIEVLKQN